MSMKRKENRMLYVLLIGILCVGVFFVYLIDWALHL